VSERVADRAVERGVEAAKTRARDDVQLLISAGFAVLLRKGAAEMTIAEVLAQAGLSTRAFYRHFSSKSDLLLAIYEHEVQLSNPRLQRRLDAAANPAEALVAWIDELLEKGFKPRRGERTRAMFSWAVPLQQEFPAEFAAIRASLTDPLQAVLAAGLADGTFPGTDPARDASFIRALTWELVEEHLTDPSGDADVVAARDAVLRFALPALRRGM
jgi:AcrR family transcriptional regulator